MEITAIDGTTVNGLSDIDVRMRIDDATARSVSIGTRGRSQLGPVVEDIQGDSWRRPLFIMRASGSNLSDHEFDELVWQHFRPDMRRHTLTAERDGTEYELDIEIESLNAPKGFLFYLCVFQAMDPYWHATTNESGTSSPLTVSGNVEALPVITITGGAAVTKKRVTVFNDDPLTAYPIGIAVSGAENTHIVWHRGRRVPFSVDSGFLFVRIDTDLPKDMTRHRAFVDVYSGASIDNQLDAGKLDQAGLVLDSAINSGTVQSDPTGAIGHAQPPAYSWVPAITGKHDSSSNYRYGIDGDTIKLIDSEETGERVILNNDVDSLTLISPQPMTSISDLDLDVFVGYRKGTASAEGATTEWQASTAYVVDDEVVPTQANKNGHQYICITAGTSGSTEPAWTTTSGSIVNDGSVRWQENGEIGKRVMRVRIQDFDGEAQTSEPVWRDDSPFIEFEGAHTGLGNIPGDSYPLARQNYLFYAEFTFGSVTFPHTYIEPDTDFFSRGGVTWFGTNWNNDYLPWELPELAAEYIGCTVTQGAPGEYFLHFPDDAFGGQELPLLSMSLQAKSGSWTYTDENGAQSTLEVTGNTALNDLMLFEADWVDPITLEPIDDRATGSDEPEQDTRGMTRLVVRYWLPDSEYPVTAFSRTLKGYPTAAEADAVAGMTIANDPDGNGVVYSLSGANINLAGAIQVAIGLEPAAASPNQIDWGTLEITDTPTINLSQTPSITVASVNAQHLDGTLRSDTTDQEIVFSDVFSHDTGLEIDVAGQASHEVIRGAGGVGPVHGFPLPDDTARWIELLPGSNTWSVTGGLVGTTISFEWPPRLGVQS